ncbi:MAG: hypothetical protein RL638_2088 [Bacteroidota bacterium]|jgi:hypothetical protein
MKQVFILSALLMLFSGCSKEEHEPHDDNELITTVKLQFTSITSPSSPVKTFYWRDTQGDGVVDSIDPIVLDKGSSYKMDISLLDETKKPVFDITEEIAEESDVHLFVYKSNPLGFLTTKITDLDKNGLAIGLKTEVSTQYAVGNGKFQIILKHQPPVNGKAVKDGSEQPGSTDVDVEFPVSIK